MDERARPVLLLAPELLVPLPLLVPLLLLPLLLVPMLLAPVLLAPVLLAPVGEPMLPEVAGVPDMLELPEVPVAPDVPVMPLLGALMLPGLLPDVPAVPPDVPVLLPGVPMSLPEVPGLPDVVLELPEVPVAFVPVVPLAALGCERSTSPPAVPVVRVPCEALPVAGMQPVVLPVPLVVPMVPMLPELVMPLVPGVAPIPLEVVLPELIPVSLVLAVPVVPLALPVALDVPTEPVPTVADVPGALVVPVADEPIVVPVDMPLVPALADALPLICLGGQGIPAKLCVPLVLPDVVCCAPAPPAIAALRTIAAPAVRHRMSRWIRSYDFDMRPSVVMPIPHPRGQCTGGARRSRHSSMPQSSPRPARRISSRVGYEARNGRAFTGACRPGSLPRSALCRRDADPSGPRDVSVQRAARLPGWRPRGSGLCRTARLSHDRPATPSSFS